MDGVPATLHVLCKFCVAICYMCYKS